MIWYFRALEIEEGACLMGGEDRITNWREEGRSSWISTRVGNCFCHSKTNEELKPSRGEPEKIRDANENIYLVENSK